MRGVPESLLVVLDEAYTEFVTDPDAVKGEDVLAEHPNLVILRTFSKAYGLAGLRIGYAVGPEYVIDAMRTVATPLAVTDFAQRAALASLDDEAELLERVAAIANRRDRLRAGLLDQGWPVPEAQGNFVWLPTGEHTLEAARAFEAAGLVVRPLGEGVRISVGEEESVEKLLRSAGEVVAVLRSRGHFPG
jgi:histidinol-phosphate aminotransferase